MYSIYNTDETREKLKNANRISTSISNRLDELEQNPFTVAISTNIPRIGDYYVNAGRYCILFDIDPLSESIYVRDVVLSAKLHKILTGRI